MKDFIAKNWQLPVIGFLVGWFVIYPIVQNIKKGVPFLSITNYCPCKK